MTHKQLVARATKAIRAVFDDKTVSKSVRRENLDMIISTAETLYDALRPSREELEQADDGFVPQPPNW